MAREVDRRDFLRSAAGAMAAAAVGGCKSLRGTQHGQDARVTGSEPEHGLGAEDVDAPAVGREREFVRAILREADGSAIEAGRARLLYARDLENDPVPVSVIRAEGRARVGLPQGEAVQLCGRLKVPGFGEVYCFADNGGKGYTKPETIDFVEHAAATRLRRVREAYETARRAGVGVQAKVVEHLQRAAIPLPREAGTARTAAAYERLSHGLHAGEMVALASAHHRISRFKAPRKDFKFGAMISGWNDRGPGYTKGLLDFINFATVGWYWWRNDQRSPWVDYTRMDSSMQWCWDNKVTPKGFGYCYMARGATAEWARPMDAGSDAATMPAATTRRAFNPNWPYEKLKAMYSQVVEQTMRRYAGKLEYAEIMNEAHDKANLWHLDHGQILEMAREMFAAARRGSSTVKRQMNHCCMWAEYAKDRNVDGSKRWSPYQFIKACFDHGIDYEVIGLQLYYPQFDVFEIDRMLDRFAVFNRPIHITEIAASSQDGFDLESMRPKTYAPGWHGPWNETMQADWAEAMYTLAYSKEQFEAITWWDFADVKGKFWPFGGLLRGDMTPKEGYVRLQELRKRWGVGNK